MKDLDRMKRKFQLTDVGNFQVIDMLKETHVFGFCEILS